VKVGPPLKSSSNSFICSSRREEALSISDFGFGTEPPTPKMSSEEKRALTPALSPQERGKRAQRPEIFMFSGVAPSHGDLRPLLQVPGSAACSAAPVPARGWPSASQPHFTPLALRDLAGSLDGVRRFFILNRRTLATLPQSLITHQRRLWFFVESTNSHPQVSPSHCRT